MIKLLSVIIVLFTLLFFNSCSEKITLTNDQKETAIIYGLLDQADTIHYIKINRAFSGMNNSLEIAQIPDSSYFKDVQAYIYEIKKGDTLRRWKLRDTLINNKEAGIFFAPKQKVYYFQTAKNTPLVGENGRKYTFYSRFNQNQFSVTAATELIYSNGLGYPVSYGGNYSFASGDQIKPEYYSMGIEFKPGTSVTTNTTLRISFKEFIDQQFTIKSFDWNIGDADVSPGITKSGINALGSSFYPLIVKNCTNNPAITKRQIESIELRVTFGSEVLNNYLTLNKPSSSLAQNKTNYTNLTATNGMRVLGVFTSRNTLSNIKKSNTNSFNSRALDFGSTKELCLGAYTRSLLFCSDIPEDNKSNFYCN